MTGFPVHSDKGRTTTDTTRQLGPDDGLRARKRAATESAITTAAMSLALEHGYEHVTVDMICEASMISQRTFFNYFGSKEGVFFGRGKPMPSEEQVAHFVHEAGANILGDLMNLFAALVVDHEPNIELFQLRRKIIQQTPELMRLEKARVGEMEEQFLQIVMARFQAEGRSEAETPDLEDEARMVIALAAGAMHYAMRKWVASNFTVTRDSLLANVSDLIQRVTDVGSRATYSVANGTIA